jgi:hypothetical protein
MLNTMYVLMVNKVKCISGTITAFLEALHITSDIIRLTCSMFRMSVLESVMKS